ncbi:MAG TPA: SgcJ/EcaC family oxidoreductase [Pirellulaceae bacterium]|nr:SgcJ/EcaC family oxidoreductase [Pirellulaceae bacterium]HMO91825.1 SgcJ/EcaC family oxidoreductase [Pirellulaceae bacterium]HMP69888.1 SgcJ/EcaC family oxidoreductase [Pirellulaceae bacterium]
MRVAVFVKATMGSETGEMPGEELFAEMGRFNQQLIDAGVMKMGEGLRPTKEGFRVRFSGKERFVTAGPFAETNELVAGFWLWEVDSIDEAIEWVKKCPNPMDTDSDIEIRPLYELDDFAEFDPSGELREEEAQQARQLESMSDDEAAIRRLIATWTRALERKDPDALVADYAEDAVLFDCIPPYKTVGREAIRQVWANCFPYFPDHFRSEHRDLVLHVDGHVAVLHSLHHFVVPDNPDHPCAQSWLRVTVGYRKIDGRWKVVHDHVSMPFNPMTNQTWPIRDPDRHDMPDYAAAGNQAC